MQVEDYRLIEKSDLFKRLSDLGFSIDEDHFIALAGEVPSPEELTDLLWAESEDVEGRDQVYLLLFEIWRRLLPHRESLSIFCDELDYQIFLYDEEQRLEDMDELLVHLEDVLDSYVDAGENAKKMFQSISLTCAYDLERFLFEYIMDLIDAGEQLTASELIDGFFEYVSDIKSFEFLRVRLFADVDPQETALLLTGLVETLKDPVHFDLLIEIASFLVSFGQDSLYRAIIAKGLGWLKTEDDFFEILGTLQGCYCCLDQEEKEAVIKEIVSRRANNDPLDSIDQSDRDIDLVRKTLNS